MSDTKEKTTVELELDTVNAVLQYLATQPYAEVVNLIGQLHKEVQPQMKAPDSGKEP